MGYYLVKAILNRPPDGVSDRPLLVLIFMAHIARDRPEKTRGFTVPRGVYNLGWRYIARAALRRKEYDHAAEQAVSRCIRILIEAGAIVPVDNFSPGAREAAYFIIATPDTPDNQTDPYE